MNVYVGLGTGVSCFSAVVVATFQAMCHQLNFLGSQIFHDKVALCSRESSAPKQDQSALQMLSGIVLTVFKMVEKRIKGKRTRHQPQLMSGKIFSITMCTAVVNVNFHLETVQCNGG